MTSKTVIKAYEDGYRVRPDDQVVSPHGRVLKLSKISTGYLAFSIRVAPKKEKGSIAVCVHQLAMLQREGPAKDGIVVRHLDGNKENNTKENLAYGSQQENMMDRPAEERREHAMKAARVTRKLSDDEVALLRSLRAEGAPYKDLCARFGIAKSTVPYIVNKKTYAM